MRLINNITCKAIGHEPNYFQARMMINGSWGWHKHARCARCDSINSHEIHTPGILDFQAWLLLGAEAFRFTWVEWHRRKRRAFHRWFRKRTS